MESAGRPFRVVPATGGCAVLQRSLFRADFQKNRNSLFFLEQFDCWSRPSGTLVFPGCSPVDIFVFRRTNRGKSFLES